MEDSDGEASNIDTTSVTVNNVAPIVTATGDTIDEDGTATVSGTISDPGTEDTFTVTIDWGEGAPEVFSYPVGATGYSETHQYLDDNPTGTASGVYSVSVTVEDGGGGVGNASTGVTVNNVAPIVTATGDTIDEDGTATVSGTISDPGTEDTFTVTIDWGEGAPEVFSYPVGATGYSETHQYLDDNPTGTASDVYSVSVTVEDDDGGVGNASTGVTVNNVVPIVSSKCRTRPACTPRIPISVPTTASMPWPSPRAKRIIFN